MMLLLLRATELFKTTELPKKEAARRKGPAAVHRMV